MSLALASRKAALLAPWLRNPLWALARAVPSLDLRFADDKSLRDAVTGQNLITFTRASSGTFVGSDGVLQTASNDEPRFDHDPTTGESLGLLVEEQRSNLLLNSGTLSTQSVTVTAVAHTLSFTGTGTITLTGTSTAGPLVGTGTGEANRVSLTFTPTAGSLTLTVSGTVTNAQLEIGAFRTSYIATTGAAATRAADVASITGTAFSSWYRQDEGTVFAQLNTNTWNADPTFPKAFAIGVDDNNGFWVGSDTNDNVYRYRVRNGGSNQFGPANITRASTVNNKVIMAIKATDFAIAADGGNLVTGSSGTVPSSDQLLVGRDFASVNWANQPIRRLTYWPTRFPDPTLESITR